MAEKLTRQQVYGILSKGRSISDEDWVRHTRDHSLRTVYHMCEALRISPGRLMSFRDLHDIFRKNLRAAGVPSPPDGFNPVDHISALWTIFEASSGTKLEGDFAPEITELLERIPENKKQKTKYHYLIRRNHYDLVASILDELNGVSPADTTNNSETVAPPRTAPVASLVSPEALVDLKSARQPSQVDSPSEAERFRFSETELEEVSDGYWGQQPPLLDLDDARERVQRHIVIRRGQQDFRAALIEAYGGKCAVTAYDAVVALEAAHLVPFKGELTNQVVNGLLLRGDIHTLLDLNLIAFHPESRATHVADALATTSYRFLKGSVLREPLDVTQRPSRIALQWRWELFLKSNETQ